MFFVHDCLHPVVDVIFEKEVYGELGVFGIGAPDAGAESWCVFIHLEEVLIFMCGDDGEVFGEEGGECVVAWATYGECGYGFVGGVV